MSDGPFGIPPPEGTRPDPSSAPGVADLLELPEAERALVNWLLRREDVTLEEAAVETGRDADSVRTLLEALERRGFVEVIAAGEETRYRARRLAPKRTRRLPEELWKTLDDL